MTIEEFKQLRRRFYDDFVFFAKHAVKIRTKEGQIVPLVLNRVQRRFVKSVIAQMTETGRVRVVVLKARQQGLSTVISAFIYWWTSQRKAQKAVVVTHKADSTRALFDMYKRVHQHVPESIGPYRLRPETVYSSRKELSFGAIDTSLMVATAGGDGIARGETILQAHLSELAFWPKATAAENFNGIMQSIPNSDGTAVFVESTANGFNDFNTMWTEAVAGQNGFIPFFAAWFETPEYREEVPEGFERTLDEQDLAETFGLDDGQLVWRRRKIAQTSRELFMQEYPATPEEAFIASGRPVFDPEIIIPLIQAAPAPLRRMAVEAGRVVEHSAGELYVYKERDDTQVYTIGADVAMGVRNGDYSVAQVLDGDKNQVAVWHGHIHPDAFADVLAALGHYYNTALIAPERNQHGLLTCVRLWKDLRYPNVFMDVSEGQIADKESINIGFLTNVRTKPLIIDRLRATVREKSITLNDKHSLTEMRSFIVTESGSMEAEEGKHDDRVMALAIANHVHQRKWTPIVVTDEYYVSAI